MTRLPGAEGALPRLMLPLAVPRVHDELSNMTLSATSGPGTPVELPSNQIPPEWA